MMEMNWIMHIAFVVSIVLISTIPFTGTAGLITTRFSMIHGITDHHGRSHGDGDGDTRITAGVTRDTDGDIRAMDGHTIHHITEADGGEEATTLLIIRVTRRIRFTREIQEDILTVNVGQQEQTW